MAKKRTSKQSENTDTFPFVFNRQPDVGIMERQVIEASSFEEAQRLVKRESVNKTVDQRIERDLEGVAAPDPDSDQAAEPEDDALLGGPASDPEPEEPANEDQPSDDQEETK